MATSEKLIFDIITGKNDLESSLTGIEKKTKRIEASLVALPKSFKNVASSISSISTAIGGLVTGVIGFGTAFIANKVVQAAREQEDAINALNAALKANGNFTEEASKELQDFATQLQNQSKIGDEVVLQNIALLQSIGSFTTKGLKVATQAAADLAAAYKIDLDTAIRLVGKAANGEVGSLKRLGIEVKKGATDAETFANAIEQIRLKAGGAALAETKTFSGAISQLSNAFSDVLEEIGSFITKSSVVVEVIGFLRDLFFDVAQKIKEFRKGFILEQKDIKGVDTFVDRLKEVNEQYSNSIVSAKKFSESIRFDDKALASFGGETKKIVLNLNKAVDGSKKFSDQLIKSTGPSEETIRKIREEFDQLEKSLKNAGKTVFEIAAQEAGERMRALMRAERFGIVSAQKSAEVRLAIERDLIKKVEEEQKKLEDSRRRELSEAIQIALQNPFNIAFQNLNLAEVDRTSAQLIAAGSSVTKNLLEGSKGAASVISGIGGGVANALLPGLGVAVQPIIDALARGPEAVRSMVKEFVSALPEVIKNIILSIPEFIIALAESIGPLIEELALKIPEAIEAFISRLPEVAIKLIEAAIRSGFELAARMPFVALQLGISLAAQAPTIAIRFVDELVRQAPRFVTELIKQIPGIIGGAFRGAFGAFGDLAGNIGGVFGSIGKGIGSIGGSIGKGIKKVFKFSDGGKVPGGAPFFDRIPALLTPGENILDRTLSQQLEDFLSENKATNQSQTLTINIMLSERILASTLVDLNRRGFKLA
ncbi:MAG: hypothetical protein QW818_02430 [Candidatus Aenigmatarchaeota archaeon]